MIKETADALVATGLRDLGYTFVNLDGGWPMGRNRTNGRLVPDPSRFPGGIRSLADYVHARKLKLGIYTARSQWSCDGTPGSYSFEAVDADTICDWQVDYLKIDNCGGCGRRCVLQRSLSHLVFC